MANLDTSKKNGVHLSEHRLRAIALSRGVGVGRIEFLEPVEYTSAGTSIAKHLIENEVGRLKDAARHLAASLHVISADSPDSPLGPISSIFDSHVLLLESLVENLEETIREHSTTSESAIRILLKSYEANDSGSGNRIDIKDVLKRLLAELSPQKRVLSEKKGTVIAASEVRPSVVMELALRSPAAIVVEHGGWTSHSSILARELGIPMVSGVSLHRSDLGPEAVLMVNGDLGEVIINPEEESLKSDTPTENHVVSSQIPRRSDDRTLTQDGVEIVIRVNLESTESYQPATGLGAMGIGLYRSELLIPGSGIIPSEETQQEIYENVAAAVGVDGASIRTFDIGGTPDDPTAVHAGHNPSLGLRSIRLSLSEQSRFRTQLTAILKANSAGNLRIVLPFVSNIGEIQRAKEILGEEAHRLMVEGCEVLIPSVGVMIEVPSAVLMAREIAGLVDFLCLGTNDLVQYLLAVDRDNELVSDWYQTLHPAVIRAIREVASAGRDAGIPVTVCGEMAGSAFYLPLLLGLGVRELSMSIRSLRPIRRLISGITIEAAFSLASKAAQCLTANEVERTLRRHYADEWRDLFPAKVLTSPLP